MRNGVVCIAMLLMMWTGTFMNAQEEPDPYLWLEEIDGAQALSWVKAHDSITVAKLSAFPEFENLRTKTLEILNSKSRIPLPRLKGEYVYNYWMDEVHERGIWRRCKVDSYLKQEPEWETVIDIDALAKSEQEKWVYKGTTFLYPENKRCLVFLSRGGGDATVVREFNCETKEFVPGGFFIPECKNSISWKDENTLFVGADFGPGTMTESGYPRILKLWKRGTALAEAETVYMCEQKDISVSGYTIHSPDRDYHFIQRGITFYTSNIFAFNDGKLTKLEIPEDADFTGIFHNQLVLELKSNWSVGGQTYLQGSMIAIDYDRFMTGDNAFTVIIAPEERASIAATNWTKNFFLVKILRNVSAELYLYSYANGKWDKKKVDAPAFGSIDIAATDDFSDAFFYTYRGFLSPTTLYYSDERGKSSIVKTTPGFFKTDNLQVRQFEAQSKDGTRVPYFIVSAKSPKQLTPNNPTLILAYGGFEVSYAPFYSGVIGANWLERGSIFVLANLRGGGEFGPQWHLGAIKENRQNVNDDLIAVAEDLIARKITTAQHLGIQGGSNGGLLVGSVYLQRPDLFNAVVCQVPLLDMRRYNKLLAGASWVGEYGNPDIPEEWEYIKKYSPYHNIRKDETYPAIFLTTSTRDDRVHPAHARKMAARLEASGHPFYYYENTEGGHGAGVTNLQTAFETALAYSYLWMQLGEK